MGQNTLYENMLFLQEKNTIIVDREREIEREGNAKKENNTK